MKPSCATLSSIGAALLLLPSLLPIAAADSLDDACQVAYARAALPAVAGLTIDASTLTAGAHGNYSAGTSVMYPDAAHFDYCNVTFAYSHDGRNDTVLVTYWLPRPELFQHRFLATGGGGLAINSGAQSVAGGIPYGAVGGLTDGGFGGFDKQFDDVFLLANGTVDWEKVFLFGYEAIGEMTTIGKRFAQSFYNASGSKIYSYYQGCSEGGREGWSQVQRYSNEFDGAIIGAPAIRFSFQQVNHLYSNVVEQTLDYYPPPCELEKIVNATIEACDPMDGLTDGVVARSDLCKLDFNASSIIGQPYYCAASSGGGGGVGGGVGGGGGRGGGSTSPAQNGTVTAKGVAVANAIIQGLRDSQGRQVYLSYQPAASFVDAQTAYDSATGRWEPSISGLGGEWVERFLRLQNSSTLPNLTNVTYDTLREWMIYGLQRYQDTLQTTWPDLEHFRSGGGKVLHYHGESDDSIPAASSVRYYESVRTTMYPGMSYNASVAQLSQWYRLFLVPGAAHCSADSLQPNGWFPQTNLQVMIDWVEAGVEPATLNATVLTVGSQYLGQNRQICAWPLRPLWVGGGNSSSSSSSSKSSNNSTSSNSTSSYNVSAMMQCVFDNRSIESWHYNLDGVPVAVY